MESLHSHDLHPAAANVINLDHPKHIEALVRHLFSESPAGMSLVEKHFGQKMMPVDLPPPKPINRLMHEPYSSG